LNVGEDDISEAVYTQSNSTVTFYEKGNNVGSGGVYTATTTSGVNIGDISNGNYPRLWDGTIHEIFAYNRALSDAERAEVEGYLADKYGLYNVNATWPLAFSSDVQAQISLNQWNEAEAENYVALQTNNPDMLTDGLLLWFKADAGVTQDGSGNVTTWADQTGNYTISQSGSAEPTSLVQQAWGRASMPT
jgi:hypothetical protein